MIKQQTNVLQDKDIVLHTMNAIVGSFVVVNRIGVFQMLTGVMSILIVVIGKFVIVAIIAMQRLVSVIRQQIVFKENNVINKLIRANEKNHSSFNLLFI